MLFSINILFADNNKAEDIRVDHSLEKYQKAWKSYLIKVYLKLRRLLEYHKHSKNLVHNFRKSEMPLKMWQRNRF